MTNFRSFSIFILTLFIQICFAQQTKYASNSNLYKDVETSLSQKNYQKALELTKILEEIYPLDYEVYQKKSETLFFLKNYSEAIKAIDNAIALEPTNYYNHLQKIGYGLYAEDLFAVNSGLELLTLTCKEGQLYDYSVSYINAYVNAFKDYKTDNNRQILVNMSNFSNLYLQNKTKRDEIQNYIKKIIDFKNFNKEADFKNGLDLLNELQVKYSNGTLNSLLYNFFLQDAIIYYSDSKHKNEVENLYNLALSKKYINPLQAFVMYKNSVDYSVNPNYIKEISKIIEAKAADYNYNLRVKILLNILQAENNLNNKIASQEIGESLKKFIPLIKDHYTKMTMYCWIAAGHQYNNDEEGLRIIDEGLNFAKNNGYSNTKYEANLIKFKNLLLASSGQNLEVQTISEDDHSGYFNIANQHLQNQEYSKMSEPLEKAKKIIEDKYKNLSLEEKKNYLLFYNKVCSNLLGSYIFQEKNPKIIETLESYKAFYLSSLVKNNTSSTSLAAIQKTLKTDEALIYIMKGITIGDGMFMIIVVDKYNVNSKIIFPSDILSILPATYKNQYIELEIANAKNDYRKPIYDENPKATTDKFARKLDGEFRRIIEMYRENLHPNKKDFPHFLNEPKVFGNVFYKAIFQPLEEFVVGKKKLIFSLDQELNLIPFESFVTNDDKFLIEKYDIAYIQNGSMLVNLRNQPKVTYPKNVIAFGDAKYEEMTATKKKFSNLGDLVSLNFEVADRIEKNLPLNEAFATFSIGAMEYLIGAKKEVENIQQIVPKTDLRMDKLMTENEFKRMAKSGELNNYRVIHLSSHASVHRYVFDLSGIAFSVPANPVDGEDGILVIKELEKLKFKTDFVMLSACQTGLGQIIPGEGVIGLNSALFSAGAKNTLTSLWSVNDYATSIFTTNVYRKIFTENKPYKDAVNEVKREFINGKYNTDFDVSHPNYWAAFTYFGE